MHCHAENQRVIKNSFIAAARPAYGPARTVRLMEDVYEPTEFDLSHDPVVTKPAFGW